MGSKNKEKKEFNQNLIKRNDENESRSTVSRRSFLGKAVATGLLGAGFLAFPKLTGTYGLGLAQKSDLAICSGGCEFALRTDTVRASRAREIRIAAANYEYNMTIPAHPCNGDESDYADRNFFASYTKGLKRSSNASEFKRGEVDSTEYCRLLLALQTANPATFEAIQLGFSNNCSETTFSDSESTLSADAFVPLRQRRLESPQAGSNYDLEGKDYYQLINRQPTISDPAVPVAFPPAFKFNSPQEVAEIAENYWQALTRDVPFINYSTSSLVTKASQDLDAYFKPYYYGPLDSSGNITPAVYSRGILPGDKKGPFLSQFFLRDVPYGAQSISARINSPLANKNNDFMTDRDEWLMIQTGQTPNRATAFDGKKYIRSGRDLAEYVHNDAIYQAYLNAALILMTSPDSGGLGVPINPNNPYNKNTGGYCKQNNFVEFGPSQLLSLLGEVSVRAHKAVWYQKWNVHRRLRPEEFAGRIHFNSISTSGPIYPINNLIYSSNILPAIAGEYNALFLPQAFPEGSPMHPAYGAGHATLAGACVTILKAWFDSEQSYSRYAGFFEPAADGNSLVPLDMRVQITIAEELNKLASNVAIGRNIGGVHWRSDYTESVFLGEQVAIQLLEDYGYTYNERFNGFIFRNFSGQLITVGGNRTP